MSRHISPENLPVKYGGLKRENDIEFFPEDKASELIVKPNSASCIQIPVIEVLIRLHKDSNIYLYNSFFLIHRDSRGVR
jgi:hypothetical protein